MGFFSGIKHFFTDSIPHFFKSVKTEVESDFNYVKDKIFSPAVHEVEAGATAVNDDIKQIISGVTSSINTGISGVEHISSNVIKGTEKSIADVSHGVSDSIDSATSNLALPLAAGIGIAGIYLLTRDR